MTHRVTAHKWWDADRTRLVDSGDPDAAFLAFARGTDIPDSEARRVGLLKGDPSPVTEPDLIVDGKIRATRPANKLGRTPVNKSNDTEETL